MPKSKSKSKKPETIPLYPSTTLRLYTQLEAEVPSHIEILLASSKNNAIALDAEWSVTFQSGRQQRPVAMIQLATQNVICLIHVYHMKTFPEALKKVLEDKSIKKVGLNLRGDALKIQRDFGIESRGLVELNQMHTLTDLELNFATKMTSLALFVDAVLGMTMGKAERIGNWERPELREEKLIYAANDAWVVIAIYNVFLHRMNAGADIPDCDLQPIVVPSADMEIISQQNQEVIKSQTKKTSVIKQSASRPIVEVEIITRRHSKRIKSVTAPP